jgi:hypothetical protein
MAAYKALLQGNAIPAMVSFVANQNQQNFNNLVKAVVPNIIDKVYFNTTISPTFTITGKQIASSIIEEQYDPPSGFSEFVKPTVVIESPAFKKTVIAPAGVSTEKDFRSTRNTAILISFAVIIGVAAASGMIGYRMGQRSPR